MTTQGCGRVDNHQPHPWTRPTILNAGLTLPARGYACPGNPIIEGGHPCVECQRTDPQATLCRTAHCANHTRNCTPCMNELRDEGW